MMDVEANSLKEGHMFPSKDIFLMRIAEEAILWNIHVQAMRSDYSNLRVVGSSFFVASCF